MRPSSSAPDHPVTVVLPGLPGAPTIIDYRPAGLRFAIVDRTNVNQLDERWDTPGNYILLDPTRSDGTYDAYVGKAPMGLKARLRNHVSGKQHWSRALLLARDSYNGFHSAEVSWLEGRLYDHLHRSPAVTLSNRQRPRDETLPQYERDVLEFTVDPVTRLLAFIGHRLDATPGTADTSNEAPAGSAAEAPIPSAAPAPSRRKAPSVKDLLERGILHIGQSLYPPARGRANLAARVMSDGCVEWNGTPYGSLSGAGAAALGGTGQINGFDYWHIEIEGGQRITIGKHLRDRAGGPDGFDDRAVLDRSAEAPMTVNSLLPTPDSLLALVNHVRPGHALNRKQNYIGLTRQGTSTNAVMLRTRRDCLIVEFHIPQSGAVSELIEASGLEHLHYDDRWGRYRIRLRHAADVESHRDLLVELISRAFNRRA